jgi:UDP-3-O-[3-hydroxymyristoyl] glucosamine N-acyltransferase
MRVKLGEIARLTGGRLVGDAEVEIAGVASIGEAGEGDITFIGHPRYADCLHRTKASAIIVGREIPDSPKPLIIVPQPYLALAQVLEHFVGTRPERPRNIHPTAVVAPDAIIGDDVSIGAYAVIEDGASVGPDTIIFPHVYIGASAAIGKACTIHPLAVVGEGVVLGDRVIVHAHAVIGSDGFGYARDGNRHRRIPQIGTVLIGDDVEIGAGVTIDRATLGATRIGRGTKIDNLVQIGHNVTVGEDTIIVAQVGISGSTEIGSNVILAGQAGLVGHISVGDGAVVGAQAGVTKSVPAGEVVSGYPARSHRAASKVYACMQHLPDLLTRVKRLEEKMGEQETEHRDEEG